MIERKEDLGEIGARHGVKVKECKRCGSIPHLKTLIDEQGYKETRIECSCGIKMPVFLNTEEEIVSLWNKVSDPDHFSPSSRPFYIGRRASCGTCLQRKICVEVKKLKEEDLYDFVCYEHVEGE